ncbi:transcriptional regulator with XRE-family HTH domain [Labrenzia sp. EL_126]|nr:transcriptional regulator with XRE-family HTH domain [Labrenzia sp. EL_126]
MNAVTECKCANSQLTHIVEEFEVSDDLKAPFTVILNNAVEVTTDADSGKVASYKIPDLDGLIRAVTTSRIAHPYKLSGPEIKFVRKAIGLKQKELATKIELTPEHLSRCENGALPISPSAEKLFRIFAFKTVLKLHKIESCDEKTEILDTLDRLFDDLKPVPAFDAGSELVFHFRRVPVTTGDSTDDSSPDDGRWDGDAMAA